MDLEIYNEDCLEGMKRLADSSIDAIICDPPFGHSTDCYWDVRLPLEEMWTQFNRVTKQNGAIVLFSQLPFTVDLINANRKMFHYEWIWEKPQPRGVLNANKMPLRCHENICVFYRRLPTYNPQFTTGKPYMRKQEAEGRGGVYAGRGASMTVNDGSHYYPRDVVKFACPTAQSKSEPREHPTQKPLELMEFLVKTYTNRWETVLDATMGSGSTGVACINTSRKFIGFETEKKFYNIARKRIEEAVAKREQSIF